MDNDRKAELHEKLAETRATLARLAADNGRHDVPELLPVTKFHPARDVALLGELGVKDVGENREQEARAKAAEVPGMNFHMIGQVQSKKANHVARWAASVHSVDSVKLARGLDRGVALAHEREQRTGNLPVFIQYSADADAQRGGVAPDGVDELVAEVEELPGLELAGFMVVPPVEADSFTVFSTVRSVCDSWAERLERPLKLSAGMSADLPAAVAAGSNIVRVGTGILGPRPVG